MQIYRCKTCGAELFWDAAAGTMKCKYCGSEFDPTEFEDATVDASSTESEEIDRKYSNAANVSEEYAVYQCNNCRGEVITSKTTMATICPYCGSAISITNKSAENFRPERILPYKVTRDKAMKIYERYAKSSPFTPDLFLTKAVIEKTQNLFVPFYLNSMRVEAEAVVESTQTTETRSGYDKVSVTDTHNTLIKQNGRIKNVPTDASANIKNELMDAIEPFDYSSIQPFNPAYMAGYVAEQPDEKVNDMMQRAQMRVAESIDTSMKDRASYNNKKIIGRNYKFSEEKSDYAMLPVWLINVDYEGQKYQYAINGDTGKIAGKLPVDQKKVKKYAKSSIWAIQAVALVLGILGGFLL